MLACTLTIDNEHINMFLPIRWSSGYNEVYKRQDSFENIYTHCRNKFVQRLIHQSCNWWRCIISRRFDKFCVYLGTTKTSRNWMMRTSTIVSSMIFLIRDHLAGRAPAPVVTSTASAQRNSLDETSNHSNVSEGSGFHRWDLQKQVLIFQWISPEQKQNICCVF